MDTDITQLEHSNNKYYFSVYIYIECNLCNMLQFIYIYILSVIYAIQSCQVVTHDETFLTTPHLGQFVVFDYNLIENLKLDYNKT